MSQKRKWTVEDEETLTQLYYAGNSYLEMSKILNRTWYACKCRLMKLKLIPVDLSEPSSIQKYTVPLPRTIQFEVPTFENFGVKNPHSHTFDNEELDIVLEYFKARLAKLAIQKTESKCYQKNIDIDKCEDIFRTEIAKVKQLRTLTEKEREKYLIRIA